MAALHDALKTLGPIDFDDTPLDDLKPFLSNGFSKAQLIVDSVPIPAPSEESDLDGRSRASSTASSASEISISSARSAPPPSDVEALQKEWKSVKMNPKENPLGMSVYKLGGKDGRGSWFARRSVHEGLGFTKWKKALEREFPETMKVQGGPGEGNIRGIGGEQRVAYKNIDGVGKMEGWYLLILCKWLLTVYSISSFCTIPGTYDAQRFCNNVPHLRSGIVRSIWRRV
jgi:Protein of unknown function (DUF3074)